MIIDEIKARLDLVDYIQQTAPAVKLRRSGKNYMGFCPFHTNTHTPSLVVFPDSQTWRCFGACNDGGSIIDWVLQQNRGWDVREVIKDLAARANIPQPDYNEPDLKKRLAARVQEDALKLAAKVMARWLVEDVEALEYAKSRGWNDETIAASGLGFSGRSTAAQVKEMRDEFALYGIDPESPQAVLVLGYRGDVAAWARKWNLEPSSFKEHNIHGMMGTPGLVYPHKEHGRVVYMSRRQLPGHDVIRQEGGEAQEWKSFNPYSVLIGERKPFFNHYHLRRDDKVVIVEGQADAITLGQWGIPAMALCGSSWKSLEGTIQELKAKYDTIYFATDADTAGEKVVTGKNGEWPLTTAFGPMLWVVRWPRYEWKSGERKKVAKDANDIAQYFLANDMQVEAQRDAVQKIFDASEPIVLEACRFAGKKQAAERQKQLEIVLPLIAKMPTSARNDFRLKMAKALFPEDLFPEYKGAPIRAFQKLVGDEIKAAKDGDEDDKPAEIEETLGGWYPVNDDGSEGYLVETIYDAKNDKARLAFAHIWLNTDQREIDTAPFLDVNGKRLVPLVDDNIRGGTILLASELGELRSTSELLATAEMFIQDYFILDNPLWYKFAGLYAVFTWVYDAFPALMYLRARGGPGTGKSELMLLIGMVCYRYMITAGLSSLAGYKGLAHIYKGTLFIDEVDNLMKEDKGEMRALLNVRAMKKQARVVSMMETIRADGTHGFTPATTYVYGPTLMTMYGAFKDPGTESRCLTFDLMQKEAVELDEKGIEPGYIPPEMEIRGLALRNKLLHWRLKTWRPNIELTDEDRKRFKLVDPLVSPRINQIMRPLKVIAVKERDMNLLNDLFLMGQANYEDEVNRRAGSFEGAVFRAVLAVHENKNYAQYVHEGKLGSYGVVRYVLYKDLATVANEVLDAENMGDKSTEKRRDDAVKANTVGTICRDNFRLPVHRTNAGYAVVLEEKKIKIGKIRYGIKDEPKPEPAPVQGVMLKGG